MFKFLYLVLVSLFLSSCYLNHDILVVPVQDLELRKEFNEKTVVLVNLDLKMYCSGVWVAPTKILTASHCLKFKGLNDTIFYKVYNEYLEKKFQNKLNTSKVIKIDINNDLALLETEQANNSWAQISTSLSRKAIAVGHPAGVLYSFISSYVIDQYGNNIIVTKPGISPGMSGGGLWNFQDKTLMGICIKRSLDGMEAYSVHYEKITEFIKGEV